MADSYLSTKFCAKSLDGFRENALNDGRPRYCSADTVKQS